MGRLTIVHNAADDNATTETRRRSIVLRLDGKAWLRVEPEALGELGIAEGDEIDDGRRAVVEDALARIRARRFVVRSLAVRMQSSAEIERKLAARHVPPELAREVIGRVAGYGYIDDASLAGHARAALGRRTLVDDSERRRAISFLARRGFSADASWKAVREAAGDGSTEAG